MNKDMVKTPSGVSVVASQTDAVVSKNIHLNNWQQRYFQACVELSAVVETNAIVLSLQDFNGTSWQAVGDQSTAGVTKITLASATDIANATNIFTSTAHGHVTGDPVIYSAGTAAVAGLTDLTKYSIIYLTANTFKLAANREDAEAGVAVDITGDGTGNQVFYKAHYLIRMLFEDSSDQAQLPLWDTVRVVALTGAADTLTVSNVYVSGFNG